MVERPSVPVLELHEIRKDYAGLRPLRVNSLVVAEGERVALAGVDALAAEVLVNLLTGAMLPDQGEVRVLGASTASIPDEAAWFKLLDRLGLVTRRAALLESLTVAQNLAMPFTLDIDPVPAAVAARVSSLAAEVGLDASALAQPTGSLSPEGRLLVHLARAVAHDPAALVLEHPTAERAPAATRTFGDRVRQVAAGRRLAVLAITQDAAFAGSVATRRLTLDPATGEVRLARAGRWFRWGT